MKIKQSVADRWKLKQRCGWQTDKIAGSSSVPFEKEATAKAIFLKPRRS